MRRLKLRKTRVGNFICSLYCSKPLFGYRLVFGSYALSRFTNGKSEKSKPNYTHTLTFDDAQQTELPDRRRIKKTFLDDCDNAR